MFYLFFIDLFILSQPKTKCPFSDFMSACTSTTREVYVAYYYWWMDKWGAANKALNSERANTGAPLGEG